MKASNLIYCLAALCGGCSDPAASADGDSSGAASSTSAGVSDSDDGSDSSSGAGASSEDASSDSSGDGQSSSSSGGGIAGPDPADDLYEVPMDSASLVVDAAEGLFANDEDPEGLPLVLATADSASVRGGVITVDDAGGFTYVPPAGAWGPDSFGYTVVDADGLEASARATINVVPTDVPLAEIPAGNGGFAVFGGAGQVLSGFELSAAGDVDGDGLGDLAISSYPGAANLGGVHIVFGKQDADTVDLTDIANGDGGFLIQTVDPYHFAGFTVRNAGDVNADGLADLVLGENASANDGTALARAYVVFGKSDTELVSIEDIMAGDGGFVLEGEASKAGGPGIVVMTAAGAGDVDGDGLDDLVVGTDIVPETGRARAWVVFGKLDTDPVDLATVADGSGGFVLEAETAGESNIEHWIAGAGDVNGDGLDDLVMGAANAGPSVGPYTRGGRTYVVHGKADTDPVDLAALAGGNGGFVVDGNAANPWSGHAVSRAGDVDGDGLADIVLSGPYVGTPGNTHGRCYVVLGKLDTDPVGLADIVAGSGGFAIDGEFQSQAGRALGGGGDVDGDGLDDIVIGAQAAATPGSSFGRAYVVYGRTDTSAVSLADVVEGNGGFALHAEEGTYGTASAVGLAPDVNGDGLADVLVGANNAITPGGEFAGRSYLAWGVSTAPY